MVSPLLTSLSLFPPFSGLSYSARARKPFFSWPTGGSGWGVKFPKSSCPLSIVPLPLRSRASHASSEPTLVHAILSLPPMLLRSKSTPDAALVRLKPLPSTSRRIGEPSHTHPHHSKLQ